VDYVFCVTHRDIKQTNASRFFPFLLFDPGWVRSLEWLSLNRLLTRFPPAPTGLAAPGATFSTQSPVWGVPRAMGGRCVLRIEDHDRTRSGRSSSRNPGRPRLAWLPADMFLPPRSAPTLRRTSKRSRLDSITRQSRSARQGLVYACDCSRRLAAISGTQASTAGRRTGELRLSRRVSRQKLPLVEGYGWGCGSEPGGGGIRGRGSIGLQRQDPEQQCGDVLLSATGTATGRYQIRRDGGRLATREWTP